MIHNCQPAHDADSQRRIRGYVEKLVRREGRIFICIIVLLTASSAFAQNAAAPDPHSGKTNPYIIDGLALGARIDSESPTYRGYQCSPSELFPEFTRCQRTQKQENAGSRRSFESTSSIMHSHDGIAVYINRHIALSIFDRNEVQNEIKKLSSRFGERAREMRMPQREGLPNAIIALWGKIQLEQLDADAISILASGQSPRKGLLVDYLGDFRRSAQLGLPIYSLNGGAGYLWSASVDRNQRGHLRFLTVDASALNPPTAMQPRQGEIAKIEKIANEKVEVDAQVAPVETENAKNENAKPTAPETVNPDAAEIGKVIAPERANPGAAEIENLAADKGENFDGLLARLEADLARTEATTQAMEVLAYRAVVGLIFFAVIIAALLFVWRARAKSGKVHKSEMKPVNPTAQPQRIHAQSPGQSELLEQKSVASKDTAPIVTESERNSESLQSYGINLLAGSTLLCSSCRNEIGASDRFCRHCGASSIAVAAPSMTFSSDEIIAKGVQTTRKRTARRKKTVGSQAASSHPEDGRNPNQE